MIQQPVDNDWTIGPLTNVAHRRIEHSIIVKRILVYKGKGILM